MTYLDVLCIYGILRAGYIPQLFSLRLPNPEVIYELIQKGHAKALVYDRSLAANISLCPVPVHDAVPSSLADLDSVALPGLLSSRQEEDIAMIFHPSGSTSGSPKLVRCNWKWVDAIVRKASFTSKPKTPGKLDVTVWL